MDADTKNHKKPVCRIDDLDFDSPFVFHCDQHGEGILIRTPQGIFAFKNSCPHVGYGLNEALVGEGRLTCIWHGWCFDVETGQNVVGSKGNLTKIPVVEQDGYVFVGNINQDEA